MSATPDLIEPVIGFRQWVLGRHELKSLFTLLDWPEATARAECRPHPCGWSPGPVGAHRAPAKDCTCGIYAHHALSRCSLWRGIEAPCPVLGAVALWGRIEVHTDGMRAERARIVALAADPSAPASHRVRLPRVARRLGVEVVDAGDLEQVAARYGRPLSARLVPAGRLSDSGGGTGMVAAYRRYWVQQRGS